MNHDTFRARTLKQGPMVNQPLGLPTILFLAALITRAAKLWWAFPSNGWSDLSFGFELGHVAYNLSTENGFSSPFQDGNAPTAWFMPLVPLLWAFIFKISGAFSITSLVTIYGIDTLVFALTTILYASIDGQTATTNRTLITLAVATVQIIAPVHLVSLTRPWYWQFQNLGVAAMIYAALKWREEMTLRRATMFGWVTGVTLLVNSVPLLLFGALLVTMIYSSSDRRRTLRGAILAVICTVGVLAPWIIRNYVALGVFVPLRQNTWVEIRQGNHPRGDIIQGSHSLHPNLNPTELNLYTTIGETRYDSLAGQETREYIRGHLWITAKRTVVRALFFWLADLFHEGIYGDRNWRDKSWFERARDIWIFGWATIPPLLFVTALRYGWMTSSRGMWPFLCALAVLPIPYYLSHIHPVYFSAVKPMLFFATTKVLFEVMTDTVTRTTRRESMQLSRRTPTAKRLVESTSAIH